MRKLILFSMGAFLALGPCALARDTTSAVAKARDLYKQGLRAMELGQTETARACFRGVLQLQPSNVNARYQLKQLSLTSGSLAAKRREQALKAVRMPKVDFDDLTLPEALETISAVVEKETQNKFSPNFIVQDPTNAFETRKITLKLGGLPASQVLKYCLDSARATARYDAHAIVIRPLGVKKSAPATEGGEDDSKPAPKGDPFAR